MFAEIKTVRCSRLAYLLTREMLYTVSHSEIGHFLCSVISQGKVVALDR